MRSRILPGFLSIFLYGCGAVSSPTQIPTPSPSPEPTYSVMLFAGDIASCDPANRSEETARILDREPGEIMTGGDNAYEHGDRNRVIMSDYTDCFNRTWGRHMNRTQQGRNGGPEQAFHATIGNHDFDSGAEEHYYFFFGTRAGSTGLGYYAYTNRGGWRIISLNSNYRPGSRRWYSQWDWLIEELNSNRTLCSAAVYHHPFVSSGWNEDNPYMSGIYQQLDIHGTDVISNGHDHSYERFAKQNYLKQAGENSPRQFVVGTGGSPLRPFRTIKPNSEIHDNTSHGVLRLEMDTNMYRWNFIPIEGRAFTDSGYDLCR